jgi:hypothetical protein
MKKFIAIFLSSLLIAHSAYALPFSQLPSGGNVSATLDQLISVRLGTSTTSVTVATGAQTFATQSGLGFAPGQIIGVTEQSNSGNTLNGVVTSYSGTTLVLSITSITGSGTHADWNITGNFLVTPVSGGGSGISRSISSVSTATNAGSTASTDYVYLISGNTTVTLPTAVGNSDLYTFVNVGTGIATVATTSSQTINGSLTIPLAVQYTSVSMVSNGTNWIIN